MASELLRVEGLVAGYGDAEILHGIDIQVRTGEWVAILGPNGAGKTTLINSIIGLTKVFAGEIYLQGSRVDRPKPDELAKRRVGTLLQGKRVFPYLTVEENLKIGAYIDRDDVLLKRLDEVYGMFPALKERRLTLAGNLSGGEQMVLAFSRAYMLNPILFMVDEPSLGVAPIYVSQIFNRLEESKKRGASVLLVEQNVRKAAEFADRIYILSLGKIVFEGTPSELLNNSNLVNLYLGTKL